MDTRRALAAAGMFVIAIGGPSATDAHADDRPAIAVHLKNQAGVPPADLARASAEVERIFGAAGVAVAWVDADAPGRLTIQLLTITRDSQERSAGCALGLAHASRSTAYVFVNRIAGTNQRGAVDLPVVLARVIAHEIGHLLMPQGRHSRSGIMRADLDAGYSNPSRFSGEEARAMRDRLRPGAHP